MRRQDDIDWAVSCVTLLRSLHLSGLLCLSYKRRRLDWVFSQGASFLTFQEPLGAR